jgi:hypothetical protein
MSDKPEKPQKPEQPDTYTEFGIEWKRIEPVAKSGGAALWSIPLGSKKNNTMHTKHFLESLERLFASLMVAFVLGAIVGVLVPATRHITISVLSEAVTLSLTHMGTTAVAVGLGLARFVQTRLPDWRSDMRKLWADIGRGATVSAIVWFGLFVFCIFEAIKMDHQQLANIAISLASENTQLKSDNSHLANNDVGGKLAQAQADVQTERDNARRWREAYEETTKGELHPDRNLDREDRRKLREDLERIAKDPRNKDYIKLDFGTNTNPETQHIAWQLFTVFRESHWNVPTKMRTDLPKELTDQLQAYSGPNWASGIFIFTDDPNQGRYLGLMLSSCCGLQPLVNPRGIPPNFKGTMLWIGNKQFTNWKDDD